MVKPDVTLQPSKGIVAQAAAQIYAAYIAAGHVKADEEAEALLKRAIREAITIARTVDTAVQSDKELPEEGDTTLRHSSLETE
jgi:hypothetical protein